MLLFFTPYTYLFLSLYFVVLSLIFSLRNFFIFWLFIEILILLFIGISYTLFSHSYTHLILYFLFQTLGSFSILVTYLFSIKYLLYTSLFLKLGIFPFFSWYINVLYRFPPFMLFLSSTIHKLPPIYIFYLTLDISITEFIVIIMILTILVSSSIIFFIKDLRYLIVVSSIGNNTFLLLAVISNSLVVFRFFYFIYVIRIILLITTFGNLTSHSYSYNLSHMVFTSYLLALLLNLASFPPFPGFFSKFLVFLSCIEAYSNLNSYFLLIIVLNVVIMIRYISVYFKYIINIYRNNSNLVLY